MAEDSDSFFLPSGLIGDDNEPSTGRRTATSNADKFSSQHFSSTNSFSSSPPSSSTPWSQGSLYNSPAFNTPSQATSPFSSVPPTWQTTNSWTPSPSSHFAKTQTHSSQPNPNVYQQHHSAYDIPTPSFFGANHNQNYANYAYQSPANQAYQQHDAFSSMVSYVAPAPSIHNYTTSDQQHMPLQVPQMPTYHQQSSQPQTRSLQPFMMPEASSKNSTLYGGAIETSSSQRNSRKNSSSTSGTNKWEKRKNRNKSNGKPSVTILERGGQKRSSDAQLSPVSAFKDENMKDKSHTRSQRKAKSQEGRKETGISSKVNLSVSADSLPSDLETTKTKKTRQGRNKKGSVLQPKKNSRGQKSKEKPSQTAVIPLSSSTPSLVSFAPSSSSIRPSSSVPSLVSLSDELDVPSDSSVASNDDDILQEVVVPKEEDTNAAEKELEETIEISSFLPPTPAEESQVNSSNVTDPFVDSEIASECEESSSSDEIEKDSELSTSPSQTSPRMPECETIEKEDTCRSVSSKEDSTLEESAKEGIRAAPPAEDAESEEDEESRYQQTISSMGALKKTWMIGFSSLMQILFYFLRPVLSIHNTALRVISLYHVAFTVIYVYAFPFIVFFVQGADTGASSASLVWYTFLVWFFINKGGISPSSSLNFRLFLPLLFVFEGVCNPRSIIAWNGGERLVLAFVLLSMKTNFFHWTCFFSLAALIVTSVFLGTNILVQWAILVIALSSLSPSFTLNPLIKEKTRETDDVNDSELFGADDHTMYNPSFEANLLPPSTSVGFYSTGNWTKSKKKKRRRF